MNQSALHTDTISWSDEFLTGFEAIDRQHRILVEMAVRLGDEFPDHDEHVNLRRTLRELVDYTLYHFAMEERLMKVHAFANHDSGAYQTHLQQHQVFVEKVLAWQEDLQRGKMVSVPDLQCFLMDWIRNHILNCDRQLTNYLSSRGISE